MSRRRLRTPDLDVPWRAVEYCVVDVETTGLDLRHDEIVSFGSVLVREGRLCVATAAYLPVRPSRPISPTAMTVHGVRRQDLEAAPPVGDVEDTIRSQLDGRVLVAHAAWIEHAFLGRVLRDVRRHPPATVDTAALLRATGLAPAGTGHEPNLEVAAGSLGLDPHTPHHALGDALTTGEVFLAAVSRLERAEPGLTARTLVQVSRRHAVTRRRRGSRTGRGR